MRALISTLAIIPSVLFAQSQQITNSSLREIVEAERAFITMAKEQNRKDAFLFFLSDSAVTQGPAGPLKGKARIKQQAITDDWLHWEVTYSDVAGSGDFGFNTGPWEYRTKKTDEQAAAYGEFNSVWKRQADGLWKNVLDIGITHGSPAARGVLWTATKLPLHPAATRRGDNLELLAAEQNFLRAVDKDRSSAYRMYLSTEARVMFSGQLPFRAAESLDRYLQERPISLNYQLLDKESASSQDLGYAYGTADVTVDKEGKKEIKRATYVRLWKKENGKEWKIVLDVLSF